MVKVGFIVDGETEMKLFNSSEIKKQLEDSFDLKIEGVVKYSGANSIKNETEDFLNKETNIVVIVLKDLEQLPDVNTLKKQIENNDKLTKDNILVVANKMIEAWFLADTQTLKNINSKLLKVKNPEAYTDPKSELKRRLQQVNKNYRKLTEVTTANLFIRNGFSFENAAEHEQCHSAKKFVEVLKKLSKKK